MNLTEAMVRIADLEAEKEELTNQVGDLTVEKDGYLEELNQIKGTAESHKHQIKHIFVATKNATVYIRDCQLAYMTELFLLKLMPLEQYCAFNKALSVLECE